ncbi:MAG: presenilin family intramembrane aspartyl protease [Methanoregulaceae archaeon]|jgi:presenilin-like A22 family membrane protease|nr:presenilin family intramembrane aspartyl protease [Methanoregulaceae archaeon]
MELKQLIPLAGMLVMMVLVEAGALLLSLPMKAAGITAFEDPASVFNPLIFIAILLAFTAVLLVLLKYRYRKMIEAIIAISIFFTFVYIFSSIVTVFTSNEILAIVLPLVLSGLAIALLVLFPEWYVIDTLGILIAAGAASIFGISLGIVPVLILLVLLAVYDAISVYKTKHMITLAEGVVEMKTPILFVIPKKASYSYIRDGVGKIGEGERGAFIMGMGDLIMPAILVVSANMFLKSGGLMYINIPALGTIIGSLAGLVVLLWFVNKGKPQAGLPPLNGGAIIGFFIGCAVSGSWEWMVI